MQQKTKHISENIILALTLEHPEPPKLRRYGLV